LILEPSVCSDANLKYFHFKKFSSSIQICFAERIS